MRTMRFLLCVGLAVTTSAQECQQTQCHAYRTEYERRNIALNIAQTPHLVALHKPVVVIANGIASITVGNESYSGTTQFPGYPLSHPMSGTSQTVPMDPTTNHFIDGIYATDQNNAVIALTSILTPVSHEMPYLTFVVPKGVTTITPYASCTQHGLFAGDAYTVSDTDRNELLASKIANETCIPDSYTKAGIPPLLPPLSTRYGDSLLSYYKAQHLTANDPLYIVPTTPAGIEKHTPFMKAESEEGVVSVVVGTEEYVHNGDVSAGVSTGTVHYIDSIFVVDVAERVVAFAVFAPSAASPSFTFVVPSGVSTLKVYSHCNKHGLFMGNTTFEDGVDFNFKAAVLPTNRTVCLDECAERFTNINFVPSVAATQTRRASEIIFDLNSARRVLMFEISGLSAESAAALSDGVSVSYRSTAEYSNACSVDTQFVAGTQSKLLPLYANAVENALPQMYYVAVSDSISSGCFKLEFKSGLVDSVNVVVRGVAATVDSAGSALPSQSRRATQIDQQVNAIDGTLEANAKHNPVLLVEANQATITIGNLSMPWAEDLTGSQTHPMTTGHFIDLIYAIDQRGAVVTSGYLTPTMKGPATFSFTVPPGVTELTPLSHCNLHGLYFGATVYVNSTGFPAVPSQGRISACGGKVGGMTPQCEMDDADVFAAAQYIRDEGRRRDALPAVSSVLADVTAAAMHNITVTHIGNGMYSATLPMHPVLSGATEMADPYAVHFIDLMWVEDQDMKVIAASVPLPNGAPRLVFSLPAGTVQFEVFCHCNRHGEFSVKQDVFQIGEMSASMDCLEVDTFGGDSVLSAAVSEVLRLGDMSTAALNSSLYVTKHTPYLWEVSPNQMKVTIGAPGIFHPMDPIEPHYIDAIYIIMKDAAGTSSPQYLWYPSAQYGSTENGVGFEFEVPSWAKSVHPFAHCNTHGHFKGAEWINPNHDGSMQPGNTSRPVSGCMVSNTSEAVNCDWVKSVVTKGQMGSDVVNLTVTNDTASTTGYALVQGGVGVFANSEARFVKMLAIEANVSGAEVVIAVGMFSSTELYSTLQFNVPAGTTSMKAFAMFNVDAVSAESSVVEVPDSFVKAGEAKCVVEKCMLTVCAGSTDYGFAATPEMNYLGAASAAAAVGTFSPRDVDDVDNTPATLVVIIVISSLVFIVCVACGVSKFKRMKWNSQGKKEITFEQCELMESGEPEAHQEGLMQ